MKIAIPEYKGRVSPVFDTCQMLRIFEMDRGHIAARSGTDDWSCLPLELRTNRLRQLGIDVLLCGGVSDWLARQIEAQGIRLVPWLVGDVDDVLRAFIDGGLPDRRFAMPGSWGKGHGWRFRRRGGHG
jgi:predicted Fe-Mo cluster-binding NifX family protein